MQNWESEFAKKIAQIATSADPAHDVLHFQRVARTAAALCAAENANPEIVLPAAWLHDFVIIPKNDPRRSEASRLSAAAAIEYLASIGYPERHFSAIVHAIECHSFSANITPRTLEAKVVQDADRLDGLGAIGIARCFATAGLLQRAFYSSEDPFCRSREPDDAHFTIDHFYRKLFRTVETLQTDAGCREGQRRMQVMKGYLEQLAVELA
ncbi:MAG: HD domain-containing protein [Bdellovibrionaceae bacterium]|nr:HD domain-containing protein [Pseudobdellovibrionaceae bacterium]